MQVPVPRVLRSRGSRLSIATTGRLQALLQAWTQPGRPARWHMCRQRLPLRLLGGPRAGCEHADTVTPLSRCVKGKESSLTVLTASAARLIGRT